MNTLKSRFLLKKCFMPGYIFKVVVIVENKGGNILTEIPIKHAARVQLRLMTLHLKVTVVKVIYSSFPVVQLLQTATLRELRWRNAALCAKPNQNE